MAVWASVAKIKPVPAIDNTIPMMPAAAKRSRNSNSEASPTQIGLVVTSTVLLATDV